MSWARVLALVFLISFTVSALLSLLILDELEDSVSGARRSGPRASASVVRHSMMPLSAQQIAYRQRLHALHFGVAPANPKDTLVSRRFPPRAGSDAASAADASSAPSSASPSPDDTDPQAQRELVDGFEQFREAAASAHSHHDHEGSMSEEQLNQAIFDSIMGSDSSSFSALDSHHSDSHDGVDSDEEDLLDEYAASSASSGLSHEDASLLFGGAGGSSFEGLSLWSLLWRGLGVDLASWNIDISNVTHTFSKPPPKQDRNGPPSQQQKREEYQRQQLVEQAQAAAKNNPQFQHAAEAIDGAAATGADSTTPSSSSSAAAPSAPPSPSSSRSPSPSSAPSARTRRLPAPSSSVLSSLQAHQGVQPYFAMMDGFQTAQLCLVHSILEPPLAHAEAEADARDQRAGLVEWFTRPAAPLLFPLTTAPSPNMDRPVAQESSFQRDASFSAIHMLTGIDLDLLLNSFADVPGGGGGSGSPFGGGGGGGGPNNGNTPRRQSVDGDWVLSEYARVSGMIHASASTNSAGGTNEEEEWLAVAYEHLPELNADNEEEQGATEIRVWFQPNSTIGSTASDASTTAESNTQSQREALVACEAGSSRVCLTIRLSHLRTVTSMHLSSSRLAAPLESGAVPLTILYALRGDHRVFRSIEVQAQQQPRADQQPGSEWVLSWKHGASGPPASRRGFISQTVSLQPFVDAPSSDLPAVRKVVAAELNWAKGPVALASSVAASSFNRWGISEAAAASSSSKSKRSSKRGNAGYLQSFPPFSAGIYCPSKDLPQNVLEDRVVPPSESDGFVAEGWVTSSKNVGLYGPDVHALSIHRGEEGTLLPLVVAASASHRFLAFAQVPLIATVDASWNFDAVEIIHLEPDTQFVGLAFNDAGTLLAIADNHQDVIVLRRTEEAAASARHVDAPAPVPVTEANASFVNESTQAAAGSTNSSSSPASPDDAASSPSPPAAPVPPPPAAPSRRRHSWEVMMEVVLPGRLRQLSLLSVQIIDVPVPASQQLARGSSVEEKTTPVLVMILQGGVLATMQLQPIGSASAASSEPQQPQQQAPAGGSTFSNHFNHPPLASQLTTEAFHAFLAVHWDLLLIVLLVVSWLVYSLPRFNRLAAEAAQNAVAAQPMQAQQQPMLQQPAPVRPRGILQALLFGNAPAAVVVNQLAANGNALPPPQQPQQQQHPAPVAMHPLNPLAQARFAAAGSAAASARSPPPAAPASASASASSSSSSSAPTRAPSAAADSSASSAGPSSPPPPAAPADAAPAMP